MAASVPSSLLAGDHTPSSVGATPYDDSGSSVGAEHVSTEVTVGTDYRTDVPMLNCTICHNLLTEPVQLDCLHNCCRQCVERAIAEQCTSVITCSVCTDVTDTTVRRENTFIEFLVQQHRTAVEPPTCGFCVEEGVQEQQADLWCSHCEKYLCHDCSPGHRKYNKHHTTTAVQEVSTLSSNISSGAVTQMCRLHKKSIDHLCIQCKLPKCYDCGLACSSMQHDLQFLKSPKTEAILSKVKQEIEDFDKLWKDKADTLKLRRDLMNDLRAARREHMATLWQNKKLVLESLERVYQAAEECLQDKYDCLTMKAQELALAAEMLHMKVSHAVRYARHIAGSADVASLIQQEKVLHTRLQSLAEKLKAVCKPLAAAECIKIEMAATSTADMEAEVSRWIGAPQMATDDLCSKLPAGDDKARKSIQAVQLPVNVVTAPTTCIPWPSFHDRLVSAPTRVFVPQPNVYDDLIDASSGSTDSGSTDMLDIVKDEMLVMRVSTDNRSEEESERCYDVAATSRNTVLIAKGDAGLIEYDYVEHEDLSTWEPSPPASVTAVDVVDDDSIVVGLRRQRVAVLSRDYLGSWRLKRYLKILQSDPFTLAVHADFVAVTEWKEHFSGSGPGPTLVLLSVSRGTELLRQDLDHNIFSVAITERTVATASWGRERPGRGPQATQDFLVAGYDHNGYMLWQRQWNDRVYGMCAAPSGRVLYLAIQTTDTVTAIREDDGRTLMNVMLSGQDIPNPWRLSITKGRGPAVLAVLESDFKTVTVYPVVAYTRHDL